MILRRSAFTLIELLVVIAVIALLVAIALPALAKARKTARLVLCDSNLKSQGQLVFAYASDYCDALPPRGVRWNRRDDDGSFSTTLWTLQCLVADYAGTPFSPIENEPFFRPVGTWRCVEIKPEEDGQHTTHEVLVHSAANTWLYNSVYQDDETGEADVYADAPSGWEPQLANGWRRVGTVPHPSDVCAIVDALTFYFSLHSHRHAWQSVGERWQIEQGTQTDNRGTHLALGVLPAVFVDGHATNLPTTPSAWEDAPSTYTPPDSAFGPVTYSDLEVRRLLWFLERH